jgi:hypothetical protein
MEKRNPMNRGDILHVIQIATLLFAAGVAYGQFKVVAVQTEDNSVQLNRIEHYLSSRDPKYWQITKEQ